MRKSLWLTFTFLPTLTVCFSQTPEPPIARKKFAAKTVSNSIDSLTQLYDNYHPGFYRYTPKEEFTAYIDSVKHSLKDSLTAIEAFRVMKPLVAKVKCLHTNLELSKNYITYLNKQPYLLPLQLYFKDGKAFVIKNFSGNKSVQPGDELISINGRDIPSLQRTLFDAIETDGNNETLKYLTLYYRFPEYYRNLIELTDTYQLKAKRNGEEVAYNIKGRLYDSIATDWFLRPANHPKKLEFAVKNNVGYLTLYAFDEPDVSNGGQNFKKFIDKAFLELKTKKIPNLIIDMRNNGGGEDTYAEYLTSYLFDRPFRYWDHIECTPGEAAEIKKDKEALKYLRAPILKDSIWIWQKGIKTTEFDFIDEQQPAKNHYTGKVYMLINGFCESSAADVPSILGYNKRVVLIGEETGGGYQGNNSGIIPDMKVKPMNFTASLPLQKYFNAVDPNVSKDRGVFPDYEVPLTVEDLIAGRDKVMELVLQLISSHS